ncbi:hypothetical protein [Sphingomonas sp. LHG3406-1]|uniref:hypothetical protein n=1 Tax=Sphingomonas sp. LHG3406-1 TaxID=2804617 RepID=UPI0026099027|nr:hypothetical protein [Sphingomonas sp. LHG3406-1]
MLSPKLEVVITPNRIAVRNVGSGATATADAPFSCSHLLADDIDILEHAAQGAMKQVVGGGFLPSYPIVEVSTGGRPLHQVERKVIRDALANAGASKVHFAPSVTDVDEQADARAAYIAAAKRRR